MTDEKIETLYQKLMSSVTRINEHRMQYNELTVSPIMIDKIKMEATIKNNGYKPETQNIAETMLGLKIISNAMVPDNSIIIGFNGKIVDIIRVDR